MMEKYGVTIGRQGGQSRIDIANRFNVAVPFIDRHLAEGRGEKIAIRTARGEDVSYAALAERVNRAGNALLAAGLKSGQRVLMIVKDCPEFFYAFWGAIKAGIVPVPVNTLLRAADYAYMIENSGCVGLIYSPEYAAEVTPALAQSPHKPKFVWPTEGAASLQAQISAAKPTLSAVMAKPDDDCFWLYSSGSTGRSKGAVHAHRDMVITSQNYGIDTLGVRSDDICFSAAKLSFAYGLGNGMTFPLWLGATVILSDERASPPMTFAIIEKFKPMLFFGIPTLYAAQLQALDQAKSDLSSLRACVSAGEALPGDIYRRWKEKTGLSILDGIGSTEALHIFISNRLNDVKPGSSGKMVPGYQARIVDDTGKPVPVGQPGRLWIKGQSTAKYYWGNPAKTAETMVDGWVDTGDTYTQDQDGYFTYGGRSDDMMKVGGIWCSPFEIEATLIEHPAVLEAAIVGRADKDQLIKPEAYIVLKDVTAAADGEAADGLRKALLEHCKKALAPYKYPRWINFVAELPKTPNGKILRYKLRAG